METISGGGGRTTDAEDITSGTFVKERIPELPTTKITEGTFDLARIPSINDVRIPDLETLSYGGTFAEAQIPDLPTTKITSGTFNANRIPALPTSRITTGTFDLNRVPSIDDARIPDLETLSYGAAFAEGQTPNLPTSKITSGTFDDARIPNIGLNDLEDVNTAGTVNGKVLTFQSGTWLPETPAGGGDMLKSVYDTDGDGIVDNSERLENQTLGSVQDHNVAAAKITSGTFTLPRIPGTLTGKDADSVDGADAGAVANNVFKIPSGIAQGDIFHVDAGGSVVKLSAGTSGHFLKTQGAGTNPQWASVPGGGDMLKSVYDTGDNSIVDNSERLEGNTLGSVRDHNVPSSKITSGTLGLARIPTMDDDHIPDLETLSYGGTFGTAQIPDLPTVKITSGTFDSDRIPILPIDRYGSAVLVSGARFMEGTFNMGSHPIHAAKELTFDHDAKFRSPTEHLVYLESKNEAYWVSLEMGHLERVHNINTYGTLDMHGHPAINFPTPTSGSHAANKTYVDAAKQLWAPVTYGITMDNYGAYPLARCTALLDTAYISFKVPDDFHSIIKAVITVIPRVTQATADWDIHAYYAAVGEAYNNHAEHDAASTYNVTNNQIFEVDISGILTSLAAGDYVGVYMELGDDTDDVDVLGVMFKYD